MFFFAGGPDLFDGEANTAFRDFTQSRGNFGAREIVELEGALPDADVFGSGDVSAIYVDRRHLLGRVLQPVRVPLVVEDQKGERLMVMQIVDQAHDRPESVLPLAAGRDIDAAENDDFDSEYSGMRTEMVFENLLDGGFLALPFDDQRKPGLRVDAEAVGDELEVSARVATNLQFRDMIDDRSADFVGMRQVLSVQVVVKLPEHVGSGAEGFRPKRGILELPAFLDGDKLGQRIPMPDRVAMRLGDREALVGVPELLRRKPVEPLGLPGVPVLRFVVPVPVASIDDDPMV